MLAVASEEGIVSFINAGESAQRDAGTLYDSTVDVR